METAATPDLPVLADQLGQVQVRLACRAPWVLMPLAAPAALVAPAGTQPQLEPLAATVVRAAAVDSQRLVELLVTVVPAALAVLGIAERMPQPVALRRPVLVAALAETVALAELWAAE